MIELLNLELFNLEHLKLELVEGIRTGLSVQGASMGKLFSESLLKITENFSKSFEGFTMVLTATRFAN